MNKNLTLFFKKIIFTFLIINYKNAYADGFWFGVDVFHNNLTSFFNIAKVKEYSQDLVANIDNSEDINVLAKKRRESLKDHQFDLKTISNTSVGAAASCAYSFGSYFLGVEVGILSFGIIEKKSIVHKFDFIGKCDDNSDFLIDLRSYINFVKSEKTDEFKLGHGHTKDNNKTYNGSVELERDPFLMSAIFFGKDITKRLNISAALGLGMLNSKYKVLCFCEGSPDIKYDTIHQLPKSFGLIGKVRLGFDVTKFLSIFGSLGGVYFVSKPYILNYIDAPIHSIKQPNLIFVQLGLSIKI